MAFFFPDSLVSLKREPKNRFQDEAVAKNFWEKGFHTGWKPVLPVRGAVRDKKN